MPHETGVAIAAPVFVVPHRWHIACMVISLGAVFSVPGAACAADSAPDAVRRVELVKLVRNDCGSCHGMQLNGGLGPALTPQALKDKPEKSLITTILYGRSGTPMPPWQAFMTEAEAAWIVENLMQGFPNAQSN